MFLPHIAKRAAAAAAVESSAVVPAAAAVPAVPIVQPLPLQAVASTAAAVTTAEPVPDIPAAAEDSSPQRPAVVVCDDCGRRHSALIPETVPAFPIQLLICGCDGRGASLQYSANGQRPWHSVSYHETATAAAAAFEALPHFKDTDPDHYRIKCSAAEIEPEPAAESAAEPVPPGEDFLADSPAAEDSAAAAAVEPIGANPANAMADWLQSNYPDAKKIPGKFISGYTGNRMYEFTFPNNSRIHVFVGKNDGMREAREQLAQSIVDIRDCRKRELNGTQSVDFLAAAAADVEPEPEPEPEPELSAADKLLPIVADNWKTLRSGDVDRLIQTAVDMGIQDSVLAAISAERPDLSAKAMREMEYYLAELRESQWKPEQPAPPSADFLEPGPAASDKRGNY